MSNVKVESNPMPGMPVRVTVPLSVAFNFEKMQNVTKVVLKNLGHEGCHSGFQLNFIHEDDFRFNEKAEQIF